MDVREFTEGLMHIDVEIKAKELEYEVQLTRCTKVNRELQGERVQTSRDIRKQEEESAKLFEIGLKLDELKSRVGRAKALYSSLSDRRYRVILESRYLHNKTWDEIKKLLGCSRTSVFRLHSEALKEIKNLSKLKKV